MLTGSRVALWLATLQTGSLLIGSLTKSFGYTLIDSREDYMLCMCWGSRPGRSCSIEAVPPYPVSNASLRFALQLVELYHLKLTVRF